MERGLTHRRYRCIALALLACSWAPGAALADIDKAKRIRIMKGVVMLVALTRQGTRLLPVGRGSGSVISTAGHILTNYHVVANTRTGRLHSVVAVALTTAFDKTPKPTCLAYPARGQLAPKLDLAVIKCQTEVDGRPLRRVIRWPRVQLGRSADVVPGDNLYIVGYPAVGGSTISFFAGKVGGFLGNASLGSRAWFKTDATVSPGVSGGAAFDDKGNLVGVPTRLTFRRGGRTTLGMVRPIDRARVLVARAVRGAAPAPPAKTAPAKTAPHPKTPPPVAKKKTPPVPAAPPPPPTRAAPAPRAGRGSTLLGRLVDAGTLHPVQGGVVLVISPGLNVDSLSRANIKRHVHSMGVSDSLGNFRCREALARGWSYGLVVLARGFRVVRVNRAIHVRRGASARLTLGTLKLQRSR